MQLSSAKYSPLCCCYLPRNSEYYSHLSTHQSTSFPNVKDKQQAKLHRHLWQSFIFPTGAGRGNNWRAARIHRTLYLLRKCWFYVLVLFQIILELCHIFELFTDVYVALLSCILFTKLHTHWIISAFTSTPPLLSSLQYRDVFSPTKTSSAQTLLCPFSFGPS